MTIDPNRTLQPDLSFESALWGQGMEAVAGIDEAGRGALAGPVCAAAVVLPADPQVIDRLAGVRDSKVMTPAQRTRWAAVIQDVAVGCGVGFASAAEIDSIRIVRATQLAAWRAMSQLPESPQHVILDYIFLPEVDLPQTALVKGDARCLSVACASVLAKTARDALMVRMSDDFPTYGFASHKGYGTAAHREVIREMGFCVEHRKSFTLKDNGQESFLEELFDDVKS